MNLRLIALCLVYAGIVSGCGQSESTGRGAVSADRELHDSTGRAREKLGLSQLPPSKTVPDPDKELRESTVRAREKLGLSH